MYTHRSLGRAQVDFFFLQSAWSRFQGSHYRIISAQPILRWGQISWGNPQLLLCWATPMSCLGFPSLYNGEGNGTPLQYSCLENPMGGGAWSAAVHGVAKSRIRLSDFTFTFHFHALEKEVATHCSVLAWRIPGMGEPAGLPSMGLHRVGHDWSGLAAAAAAAFTNFFFGFKNIH